TATPNTAGIKQIPAASPSAHPVLPIPQIDQRNSDCQRSGQGDVGEPDRSTKQPSVGHYAGVLGRHHCVFQDVPEACTAFGLGVGRFGESQC
ncbi:unnamed protein product, partial [Adineta steineri]